MPSPKMDIAQIDEPAPAATADGGDHSNDTELPNEHALVTALRDILANPQKHTVGGLADVVLHSLAELSLLKDRLDLVAQKDTATDEGVTPGSGAPAVAESPFEAKA